MKPLRERIEDRIRDTICRACIYERADGGCSLRDGRDCPIISRIPAIIDIVRAIDQPRPGEDHPRSAGAAAAGAAKESSGNPRAGSESIDPYVERLREVVCGECVMQSADGRCALREHADCALDDYFALIVDLVEQEIAAGD